MNFEIIVRGGATFGQPRNRIKGSRVVQVEQCSGAAHSNGYIDNCSLCAPRWGWVVA